MYRDIINRIRYDFAKLPLTLVLLVCLLSAIGGLALYSAGGSDIYPWAYRHFINFFIFAPVAVIIAFVRQKTIYQLAYPIFFVSLGLMLTMEAYGYVAMGARRWIGIGMLRIQPSEFMKIAVILMVARYCHRLNAGDISKIRYIAPLTILVFLPTILIARQPDLGTAMVIFLVYLSMIFASGFSMHKILFFGFCSCAALPFLWNFLHNYQKQRIFSFLNPELDPLGSGYNIIQSKIAIGSAGFFGKGIGKGSQGYLDFLPERHTDFIFAHFVEEVGFFGGLMVLLCYSGCFVLMVLISYNCYNIFARILSIGVCSMFFYHVFINIAMVTGILPVVGLPLPLMSHGGTMMATMLISLGLIMNCQVNFNKQLFG